MGVKVIWLSETTTSALADIGGMITPAPETALDVLTVFSSVLGLAILWWMMTTRMIGNQIQIESTDGA